MTTSRNNAIFFSFFLGGGVGGCMALLCPNVGPSLALDEAMNSGVGEPSNDNTHKKFWRKIWSLNMSNKVNSFA